MRSHYKQGNRKSGKPMFRDSARGIKRRKIAARAWALENERIETERRLNDEMLSKLMGVGIGNPARA